MALRRQSRGRGKARLDHEGSVWQRVVLPAVAGVQEDTPQFGWALQTHVDGVVYLRSTNEQRLHVSLPQDTFRDAQIVLDPDTGEHVIHQLQNSQYVDTHQTLDIQMQMQTQTYDQSPGWGWPAVGFMPEDEAYAGFGAFPWEPQLEYPPDKEDVATTECTPALWILWWVLGLRRWLHLVSHGSTKSLLTAGPATVSSSVAPRKRQRASGQKVVNN